MTKRGISKKGCSKIQTVLKDCREKKNNRECNTKFSYHSKDLEFDSL